MVNTTSSSSNSPTYLKWILAGFMIVFVGSMIAAMVLSELRFPTIDTHETNKLIADCKVLKVYEVGSPSHRRPNRLRTILELKDGSMMQTENGIHLSTFQETINNAGCPIYTKECKISERCEVPPNENN